MAIKRVNEFEVQFSKGYSPCSDCLQGHCEDCFEVAQYIELESQTSLALDILFNRNLTAKGSLAR